MHELPALSDAGREQPEVLWRLRRTATLILSWLRPQQRAAESVLQ
jgi:hypothetical protein